PELERDLRRNLDLSRIKLAEHLAEGVRHVDQPSYQTIIRMIKQVEKLSSDLEFRSFVEIEAARQSGVRVEESLPNDCIPAEVAKRKCSGRREGVGVDPSVGAARVRAQRGAPSRRRFGTDQNPSGPAAYSRRVAIDVDREWKTRLRLHDCRNLPAAHDGCCGS